jgi:hypothetical protein
VNVDHEHDQGIESVAAITREFDTMSTWAVSFWRLDHDGPRWTNVEFVDPGGDPVKL